MRRKPVVPGSYALVAGAMLFATPAFAVDPHRSIPSLPSANGFASIAFDRGTSRLNQFLEHPYRYPSAGVETRNFAFDSYPGVRVGTTGTWLPSVTPTKLEYVAETGIIHVTRAVSGVTVDEYHFVPMSLAEHASVTLLKVTRTSGSGPIDAYALFNFHLGAGMPTPSSDSEQAVYSASRDAIYEWGPSGVAFAYGSIGASAKHAMSPNSPFDALNAAADLANNADTAGARNDVAAGMQSQLGDLAIGASAWSGWYTVLDPAASAESAADRVRTWLASRTPAKLYADEVADWTAWQKAVPAGASTEEAEAARAAAVVLRMGQVREPGAPNGQMLASIAPGKWNIAWVRDMAYATTALVRTGHLAEAKAAIDFQLNAQVGDYQKYVTQPYKISVVRYYGNGHEEADSNQDGPNVEFDGFGLFLWELEEYVRASGDTASLKAWWPTVSSQIADTLVAIQEPSGLIAADSSIWEVHWNGKQRHFAYTTLTAAHGLCSAATLATMMSNTTLATKYSTAGALARDALLTQLRGPDGTLAQSTEGLVAKSGWLDASVVEAINFGLIYPNRRTARATLKSMKTALVPPSGRGFMRNDVGGWYDSQEWVFVDFRGARAFELNGDEATRAATFSWNVAQARENFGLFSELHERTTADYAGEAPMVGFGSGAYLLALADRGKVVAPSCGAFAEEPADPIEIDPDAGADASADGGPSTPNPSTPPASSEEGCAIRAATPPPRIGMVMLGFIAVVRLVRRRGKRT